MLPSALPGWPIEKLETLPCEVLDRDGMLVFRSTTLARLIDSADYPLGSVRRRLQIQLDPDLQDAIESWLAFIISGSLARLRITSGNIDLPRRTGGVVPCRWHYFAIPESDPDYHLIIFNPLDAIPDQRDRSSAEQELARRVDPLLLASLTARELEIVELLVQGHSPEEIGRRIHVSVHTIRGHTQSIYRKLGVRSRVQLMSRFTSPAPK